MKTHVRRSQTGRRVLLALALVACSPARLVPMGCEGHEVVALIAECHLNPHAAQQTKALLARTRSAQRSIVHARRRIGTSGRRIHLGR